MGIKILTDSTCDLTKELLAAYSIKVLPLKVNFGEVEFADGVDITAEKFFQKLEESEALPFTSQVNPGEFEVVFREMLDAGDEVMGIFISSTFSGTYNSAVIAKNSFSKEEQEKIHLFDSRTSTIPLGLIVIEASKAVEEFGSIEKVKERIRYCINHAKIICLLDTLKYLKKGGRISPKEAMIGSLLNIKPILTIDEEAKIIKVDKVRGRKKGAKWLANYLAENEVDIKNKPFALWHGNDLENLYLLKEQLGSRYKTDKAYELCIGAVIGTHLGPGCVGVAYIE